MSTERNKTGLLLAGNASILAATIFWGVNVTITKALIPSWMTADSITAVRLVGGCLLMWMVSIFTHNEHIDRGDWKRIISAGFIGLFLFIYLFVTSLRYANPIDISIIMTLPPVFVILMQVIFDKSRPSWLEYAGIILSMIGAAIVILSGSSDTKHGSDNLLGDILAVLSTICYAFYLYILGGPSKKYKPVTLLRWVFLFAAIPGIFLFTGFDKLPILHSTSATPWIEIGFILLCPTFLAYFLVQPAQKLIGSEMVSLYQYLIPVFATLSAVIMKLDQLKWLQVAAMALVVLGMIITNKGKHERTSAMQNVH